MPRHHTIWNHELKRQVDVLFTPEEEIARDEEERVNEIHDAEVREVVQRRVELEVKLADDSITFKEIKELMRLKG